MKVSRASVIFILALIFSGLARADSDEVIRSRVKRQPVVSTNVASVGYSRQLHALEIEFVRGAVYRYLDVQPRLYRRLLEADSKGRFIAENLRGKYRFVRVRPRSDAVRGPEQLASRER